MKAIKYLFLLLLIVILGGAIYFSLQDGNFSITETKTIDARPELVFKELENFKNWQEWNSWLQQEDIKVTMGSQTSGVGGSYSWQDEYGDGTMTIDAVKPSDSLLLGMKYKTSLGDSKSNVSFGLKPNEGRTEVSWTISGKRSLIEKAMNAISGDQMEEMIRPMYMGSLTNLDRLVRKKMNAYTVNVDGLAQFEGGYYLYVSTASKTSKLHSIIGNLFRKIEGYMQENGIPAGGDRMIIYENIDAVNNTVIFSAAIPVRDRVITADGSSILGGYAEPLKTVKTTLKGNHSNLTEAWNAGEAFIQDNVLTKDPLNLPIVIYRNDPTKVVSPADYLTEIYTPILDVP